MDGRTPDSAGKVRLSPDNGQAKARIMGKARVSSCHLKTSCLLRGFDSRACRKDASHKFYCLILNYASKGMRAGANPVVCYICSIKEIRVRSAGGANPYVKLVRPC